MLQIVYISSSQRNLTEGDVLDILAISRRNNRRDGLTGLLYSDDSRFLQVLEGDEPAVETALARIRRDPRHRALVVLSKREVGEREFGDWDMARRTPGSDGNAFVAKVGQLVAHASPSVRATFEELARLRNAA